MSDLAERIRELTAMQANAGTDLHAVSGVIELAGVTLLHNAPTILAGLAALEVVNNLRVRLSAVQFNYASELGIQAESLMQLEQSLGESFDSLGDAIASAVAALEERDKLRAAIAPVVAEINNRWGDVHDESWNADYHCEFEMTVAECRTLLKALEQPCKP